MRFELTYSCSQSKPDKPLLYYPLKTKKPPIWRLSKYCFYTIAYRPPNWKYGRLLYNEFLFTTQTYLKFPKLQNKSYQHLSVDEYLGNN